MKKWEKIIMYFVKFLLSIGCFALCVWIAVLIVKAVW